MYSDLVDWMTRVNQTDLPPADIIAFNFGLFENADGCYTTYLTGSRSYDPDDDDWACNEDYSPAEKYFELKELPSAENEWQDVVGVMAGLLRRYAQSTNFSESFLASAKAITFGFDDGVLERIK
jgi:hypothetical protein